jgi:acetyltransferase-like isoleucine patch superfamily enzyme
MNIINIIKRFPLLDWLLWMKNHYKYYFNSQLKFNYPSKINNSNFGSYVVLNENSTVSNSNIGKYSYLSFNTHLYNVTVGAFCSIGPNSLIGLGTHPSSKFVSTSPVFYSTSKQCGVTFSNKNHFIESTPINIGNDVWIGAGVIVLDGVSIGDGAIIGAGSVVTKNIPPYCIAVGNPAKVIKYRFSSEDINFLLNSKWWDLPEEWIIENYSNFHNIEIFKQCQYINRSDY